AGTELVALGVTAKIIVVVEHEDTSLLTRALTVKVRSRQPADSASHDHQVVGFPGLGGRSFGIPLLSVAEAMSVGESAVVIPPHPGQRGAVADGGFVGAKFARK